MIERSDLEQWMSVDEAGAIVESFFRDRQTYPDYDFYTRTRGINKDIPEEWWPLLLLARNLSMLTRFVSHRQRLLVLMVRSG